MDAGENDLGNAHLNVSKASEKENHKVGAVPDEQQNESATYNEELSVKERMAIIENRKAAVGQQLLTDANAFLSLLHAQNTRLLHCVSQYTFTTKERAVQEFLLLMTEVERKLGVELEATHCPDLLRCSLPELQAISAHVTKATALVREYVRGYSRMKEAFLKAGYGNEAKDLLAAFAETEKDLGLFLKAPSSSPSETAKRPSASQSTLSVREQQRAMKSMPLAPSPTSPKNYGMSAFDLAVSSYTEAVSARIPDSLTQHVETRTISDRLKSLVKGKLPLTTSYAEEWKPDFLINELKPQIYFMLVFNKVSDADIRRSLLKQIAAIGSDAQTPGYVKEAFLFLLSLSAEERSMLLLKTVRNVLKIGMLTYREKFITFPYYYCICTIDPYTAQYGGITRDSSFLRANMGVNVTLVENALMRLAVRARTEAERMARRDPTNEQVLATLRALLDGYALTDPSSPEISELQQLCGAGPLNELYATLGVHEPTHAGDPRLREPYDARDAQLLMQSRGDIRLYYFYDFVRGCRAESLTRMRDTAPRVGNEEVHSNAYAIDTATLKLARKELFALVTTPHKKVASFYSDSQIFSARYLIGQYMLLTICLEKLAAKGRWREVTLVAIKPETFERVMNDRDKNAADASDQQASSMGTADSRDNRRQRRMRIIENIAEWFPHLFTSDGKVTADGEQHGVHNNDVVVIEKPEAVGRHLEREGVLFCTSIPIDVLEECIATVNRASPREFMILFDGAAKRLSIPKELQVLSLSMFVRLTAAARKTHEAEVKKAGGYVFPQSIPFG